MSNVLIVGATRGLGASLAALYASSPSTKVFGTTRSSHNPNALLHENIDWLNDIDLMKPDVSERLVKQLKAIGGGAHASKDGEGSLDYVFITAGYFATEDFKTGPNWEDELKMYTTSAIAPPFIIHALHQANLLPKGSKIILITSESGSIGLRHEKEGGGNYGHHASKAASNMVGKLLSLDLKDDGVIVSIVHPGFMRTEMTKGVGFDKFYDDGGAVTPEESAKSLKAWAEGLDMSKSGEYWAPRGPRDIGTAEVTMGKNLPTPLHLPW